jgi:hypothetical protein
VLRPERSFKVRAFVGRCLRCAEHRKEFPWVARFLQMDERRFGATQPLSIAKRIAGLSHAICCGRSSGQLL